MRLLGQRFSLVVSHLQALILCRSHRRQLAEQIGVETAPINKHEKITNNIQYERLFLFFVSLINFILNINTYSFRTEISKLSYVSFSALTIRVFFFFFFLFQPISVFHSVNICSLFAQKLIKFYRNYINIWVHANVYVRSNFRFFTRSVWYPNYHAHCIIHNSDFVN